MKKEPLTPFQVIKQNASAFVNKGKQVRDVVGSIFFSDRGFPEISEKIKVGGRELPIPKVTPTTKESLSSLPKMASEIYTGIGGLGNAALSFIPGYKEAADKLVETKTGGIFSKVFPALEEYQNPKTAGEAQAMRIVDVVGLPFAGTTKLASKADKTLDTAEYIAKMTKKQELARKSAKSAETTVDALKRSVVDRYAPIETTLQNYVKSNKVDLPETENITNAIRRSLRSNELSGAFIQDKGLDRVIQEVDDLNAFNQYLIARQAIDVNTRGLATGRDFAQDTKLVKELGQKYEPYAQQVTKYANDLLDYASDSGLIAAERAAELKKMYPNYVPLNRVFSELELEQMAPTGGSRGTASLSTQSVVRGMKGSEREIEDPIVNLVNKTRDAFTQGEQNKTARLLASYEKLEGNPFGLRKLDPSESATGKSTISYLNNGVKETYETLPEIANAAKNFSAPQFDIVTKILAAPNRLFRIGTTGLNPVFAFIANPIRDIPTAILNADKGFAKTVANPANFMRAFMSAIKKDDLYKDYLRSAGGGSSFDLTRESVTRSVQSIRSSRDLKSRVKFLATNPKELFRAVEDTFTIPENAVRINQFNAIKQSLIRSGKSVADATERAARAAQEDLTDFRRAGQYMQTIQAMIPYLGSAIQGGRATVRAYMRNPKGTVAKVVSTVLAPVAFITAWNLGDEKRKAAYDDIQDWEKENNIIIVPPNPVQDENGRWNVIKIPLVHNHGQLTNPIRRSMEQMAGLDPVRFKDVADDLIGSISPVGLNMNTNLSTVLPQAIKPSVEAYANKDFFTGNPIVPQSMSDSSVEEQVRPNTSGTARLLSKPLGVSPIQTERFIGATGGEVARQGLNVADRVLNALGLIPEEQIGGRGISEGVDRRLLSAAGGDVEQKEIDYIASIIQKSDSSNKQVERDAVDLYKELSAMDPVDADKIVAAVYQENRRLYDKLESVVQREKQGRSQTDKAIARLGVTNGDRAKYIWDKVQKMKTAEEKNKYIQDLENKGLVSKIVRDQLIYLKNNQ